MMIDKVVYFYFYLEKGGELIRQITNGYTNVDQNQF